MQMIFQILILTSNSFAQKSNINSEATSQSTDQKCVQIYFDRSQDPTYWMGRTYTTLLQNLLGHFPEFQQIISPIEMYQKGDLEKCQASFYLGSYFNNNIPQDFLDDYVVTKKNVAWLANTIWKLGDHFEKIFGYKYVQITSLDKENKDPQGRPSFYKNIHYKGEIFYKYGEWSPTTPGLFVAPFDQTELKKTQDNPETEILAYSENPVTQKTLPYALRNKNYFYIADIAMSYMHEADRYLIFADLLFDILNANPRHDAKHALIRIEDVHPMVPIHWLYRLTDVMKNENVPIHISLIPIFMDPHHKFPKDKKIDVLPMDRNPAFMSFIQDMKNANAVFIWHGTTHQHRRLKNPHTAVSGDDFEFYDAINNKPFAEDSVPFVLSRLDEGYSVMKKANIFPQIWLTPHYQASALDNQIFARVFPWNIGRVIYYNHQITGLDTKLAHPEEDSQLWYSNVNNSKQLRWDFFKNLQVQLQSDIWSGQMFPYEIYGDIHGQYLFPENLGNCQPYFSSHVQNPRSKNDILKLAKRNRVLRDVWASMFYHPFLLTSYQNGGNGAFPGDTQELQEIIKEFKSLGYQFINLEEFIKNNQLAKRAKPIYKEFMQ